MLEESSDDSEDDAFSCPSMSPRAKEQRAPEVRFEIPYNYVELDADQRPVLLALLTSTPHNL